MTHHPSANPLREIIIGAAAGVGAAYVMEQFQSLWTRYGDRVGLPTPAQSDEEPATERAANRLAVAASGEGLPSDQRKLGGEAVHYATGAALGAAYGVVASSVRGSTLGSGLPFGLATWYLMDQKLVPELRLGPPPAQTDRNTQVYALVAHLVFGFTADALRRVLGAR